MRVIVGLCAATLCVLSGCVRDATVATGPERKATPVAFRIVLASDKELPDYVPATTTDGERLFVSPNAEFDNHDVLAVRVLRGERRSFLQVMLNALATERLRHVTRAHVGQRMAIYFDEEMVAAPYIQAEIGSGEIRIFGGFTNARATELANGITAHP